MNRREYVDRPEKNDTCYNCGTEHENINQQTELCPHCLELFCHKCRNCGQYYMREDRYCRSCFKDEHTDTITRDAANISSGTLAGLTGKRLYAELDIIQAEFVAFVEQCPGQYENWIAAWRDFWKKDLR